MKTEEEIRMILSKRKESSSDDVIDNIVEHCTKGTPLPDGGKLIVLISCAISQKDGIHLARDLYQGIFTNRLKDAESLEPDECFVLSTKYFLLRLDQPIKKYNVSMSQKNKTKKNKKDRKVTRWVNNVKKCLNVTNCDPEKDTFVLLVDNSFDTALNSKELFKNYVFINKRK